MSLAERLDACGDLVGQHGGVLLVAGREPDDRGDHAEEIAGSMLQLLRDLGLQRDLLALLDDVRDVPLRAVVMGQPAARIVDRADMERVPEGGAVLAVVQDLHDLDPLAFESLAYGAGGLGIGLFALKEAAVAADRLLALVAGELDEGLIDVDDRIVGLVGIGDRDRHARLLQRLAEQEAGIDPHAIQGLVGAGVALALVELQMSLIGVAVRGLVVLAHCRVAGRIR